jgi:hypothetical protein
MMVFLLRVAIRISNLWSMALHFRLSQILKKQPRALSPQRRIILTLSRFSVADPFSTR